MRYSSDESPTYPPRPRNPSGALRSRDSAQSHACRCVPWALDAQVSGEPRASSQTALDDVDLGPLAITSNLTADFTVNPDFSQIESDRAQIEVNQRFPLFSRELRPFFLEGAEIFSLPSPVTLVHARTIVDPDYGLKLTGKVGAVSLGMVAANHRAPGNVDDVDDPLFDQTAYTFIGRAVYDVYAESTVGAIVTHREFLDSHSRLFSICSVTKGFQRRAPLRTRR